MVENLCLYFSRKYDEDFIQENFVKAEKSYANIEEQSLFPDVVSQLEEEFRRKSIHGTVAIEGNPLTEYEVGHVLKSKKKTAPYLSEQEVLNVERAFEMLDSKAGQALISENDIIAFHYTIMQDIDNNNAGIYRHKRVKVGDAEHGGIYTPPDRHKDIQLLMKEFIVFINSPEVVELNPIIRGALAHYHLVLIHPFIDGNGRTARIIEALIMKSSSMKYMPELLSYRYNLDVDQYYKTLSITGKNKSRDLTLFLGFVLIEVNESIIYAYKKVTKHIADSILGIFYSNFWKQRTIGQRQYELLQTLLKTSEEITFKELLTELPYSLIYRDISERTARRDIEKLITLNIITSSEDKKYSLNRDILEKIERTYQSITTSAQNPANAR